MKSIRTTLAFEYVIRATQRQYDITMQDCMNKALRSFKKQSFDYSVNKKHKGSGKIRNLNGLQVDLRPREFQAMVIRFWLDELFKTKKRKVAPLDIDDKDEEAFLNSFIFHGEEFDSEELEENLFIRCEYTGVKL